jgi:hypothetical protein
METPKPKPVEMTEKSTPELFNAQSELDRSKENADAKLRSNQIQKTDRRIVSGCDAPRSSSPPPASDQLSTWAKGALKLAEMPGKGKRQRAFQHGS